MYATLLTFVVSLVSVLDAEIIVLNVQAHKWEDQLLLDQLPDNPVQEEWAEQVT